MSIIIYHERGVPAICQASLHIIYSTFLSASLMVFDKEHFSINC